MEKKKHTLRIETPCNEDFSAMQVSDKGHFCTSCSKHVIDFRYASDDEILRVIQKTNGELCGRLREEQLNRVMTPVQIPSTSSFFARIFSAFLLFSTTGTANVEQQGEITIQPVKNAKVGKEKKIRTDTVKHKIQGTLYNAETKKPITARIVLKHTGLSTTSTSQGYFEFFISEKDIKDEMILQVDTAGFKTTEVIIYRENLTNLKLYIQIEVPDVEFMGKIKCTPPVKNDQKK